MSPRCSGRPCIPGSGMQHLRSDVRAAQILIHTRANTQSSGYVYDIGLTRPHFGGNGAAYGQPRCGSSSGSALLMKMLSLALTQAHGASSMGKTRAALVLEQNRNVRARP